MPSDLSVEVRPNLQIVEGDGDPSVDERRAEEFLLACAGWTQARIARKFGITQSTVSHDLRVEAQRRRTRAENVEYEIERIAGVMESVIDKAWRRHDEAFEHNPNGVAASNYLKLVLEAAEKYAHLRGLDVPTTGSGQRSGPTRVVVRIGGSKEQPEIAVGVEQ